jgi:hypothetical protein
MLGSNRDELSIATAAEPVDFAQFHWPHDLTEAQLQDILQEQFDTFGPVRMEALNRLYSPDSYEYPTNLGNYSPSWWKGTRIFTDGGVPARLALGACNVRHTARLLSRGGSPAVYTYLFASPDQGDVHDLNCGNKLNGTGPGTPLVPHASELPLVFAVNEMLSDEAEVNLARNISGYWLQFAHKGNPSRQGLPDWPRFRANDDNVMRFEVPSQGGVRVQKGLRKAACDFWDTEFVVV